MSTNDHPVRSPSSERPRSFFARNSTSNDVEAEEALREKEEKGRPIKWSMGVLNDPETHEVPGKTQILYPTLNSFANQSRIRSSSHR